MYRSRGMPRAIAPEIYRCASHSPNGVSFQRRARPECGTLRSTRSLHRFVHENVLSAVRELRIRAFPGDYNVRRNIPRLGEIEIACAYDVHQYNTPVRWDDARGNIPGGEGGEPAEFVVIPQHETRQIHGLGAWVVELDILPLILRWGGFIRGVE